MSVIKALLLPLLISSDGGLIELKTFPEKSILTESPSGSVTLNT
jgi:hypothetical protein